MAAGNTGRGGDGARPEKLRSAGEGSTVRRGVGGLRSRGGRGIHHRVHLGGGASPVRDVGTGHHQQRHRPLHCQHKPRTAGNPPAGERPTEVIPGPQGELPGGCTGHPQQGGNTVMPSSFADVMAVGAATYARRDCCPGRRRAAHDLAAHRGGAPPCRCGAKPGGICSSPMRRTAWCKAGTRSRDGWWVPTVTTRRRSSRPSTAPTTPPRQRCSHSCGTPCVPCANRGLRMGAGDEHRGHRRRGRGPDRCRGTDRGRGPARGSPTDMEALCLCTLLWASIGAANRVVGELTARDFHRPVYGPP